MLSFTILFTGCSESIDHEFSHDSKLNEWVILNKKEISNFKRKDILGFSPQKQKVILRSLSSQKKKEIWQEKANYILKLDLSNEEMIYVNWFVDVFKKLNYNEQTPEYLYIQMYNKVLDAQEKFGWNDRFIYEMFFYPGKVNLGKVEKKKVRNEQRFIEEEGGNCECRYDMGCPNWSDFSDVDKCETDNSGCEFWGTSNCKGVCDNGGW